MWHDSIKFWSKFIQGKNMPFAEGSKAVFLKDLTDKGISHKVKTWTNYMENVRKNAVIVQVDNEKQVQEVARAVKKQNEQHTDNKITVRATAGWADKKMIVAFSLGQKIKSNAIMNHFRFQKVLRQT